MNFKFRKPKVGIEERFPGRGFGGRPPGEIVNVRIQVAYVDTGIEDEDPYVWMWRIVADYPDKNQVDKAMKMGEGETREDVLWQAKYWYARMLWPAASENWETV